MAKTTAASEMGLREFRNGGYQTLTEPTVITWHGKPVGLWTPVDYQTTGAHYETRTPSASTTTRSYLTTTTNLPAWLTPKEKDG